MPDADAFFGKITPDLLAAAKQLRWVQAPTVSLEHYLFPALVEHPCVLTNMRGLFSDVIADQVLGYIVCFARNLHRYVLQQAKGLWSPIGGEGERVSLTVGPGRDQRHRPRPPAPGRRTSWASSAWGPSARRSPAGRMRFACASSPSIRCRRPAPKAWTRSGRWSACPNCWRRATSW